ncbi:hypothetical protein HK405_005455, partial [Cladochytrium tenue]
DDLRQAVAIMDHTTRVTNELFKVVGHIVSRMDSRGFGYSPANTSEFESGRTGKKRGRPDAVQEELGSLDLGNYPEGIVGLELPPSAGEPEAETIGRLHSILQSLRNTPIWDKAMKPAEQFDAYPLSQHVRSLYGAMDALAACNPSSVRPSAVHGSVIEMSASLADAPSRRRRWSSQSPYVAATAAAVAPGGKPVLAEPAPSGAAGSFAAEDAASQILAYLLRPHSYEFEERWTTACPQPGCKLETHTEYTPSQFLDVYLPQVAPPRAAAASSSMDLSPEDGRFPPGECITLQSLIDERMKGTLVQFACPNENCPMNISAYAQSAPAAAATDRRPPRPVCLSLCRPELKELPPLLFILVRRAPATSPATTTSATISPAAAFSTTRAPSSIGSFPSSLPMRLLLDSLELRIARDFFDVPYRVVAAIVRSRNPLLSSQQGPGAGSRSMYSMVKPISTGQGEGLRVRWVVCCNDRAAEVTEWSPECERDIELILCENLLIRK